MEDPVELNEDELLGMYESETNLAFSEEDERRLLQEDFVDEDDDYSNQLDNDEDSSINYNEINISENCDEFYDEADESEREYSKNKLSGQNSKESETDFETKSDNNRSSDVSSNKTSLTAPKSIKNSALKTFPKPSLPHSNSNHNDFNDRRPYSFRQPRPQWWKSHSNQRNAPPPLPRGPFPMNNRPMYLPRHPLFNVHEFSLDQLDPRIIFRSQSQFNVQSGWGSPASYSMSSPIPNFSPVYTAAFTQSSVSSFANRPPVVRNVYTHPVKAAKPTIHVNPHFQGSVNLKPNMPRLAWHEQNTGGLISSSSSKSTNSCGPNSREIPQRRNAQSLTSQQSVQSSQPNISPKTNPTSNLLDTASRRRKLEESMKATSSVSPPKRLHVENDDLICLEDNNISPTQEELKKAIELGVDIAYLREYERKQKEMKEKGALIAKEKEEKRKQKILQSKALSTNTKTIQKPKIVQKTNSITSQTTISAPTQPKAPIESVSVIQKAHLTPQERLIKFSSQQKVIKQCTPIQPPLIASHSSRSVINRPEEFGCDKTSTRTVVIDRKKTVNLLNSIPSDDKPNRIVKMKSKIEPQLDNKKGNIRKAVCVGNLLPETAESDLNYVLKVFQKGEIRKWTHDRTKALVLFDNETDARNFKTSIDSVNIRGIKLRAYFYQESE